MERLLNPRRLGRGPLEAAVQSQRPPPQTQKCKDGREQNIPGLSVPVPDPQAGRGEAFNRIGILAVSLLAPHADRESICTGVFFTFESSAIGVSHHDELRRGTNEFITSPGTVSPVQGFRVLGLRVASPIRIPARQSATSELHRLPTQTISQHLPGAARHGTKPKTPQNPS